MSVIEKRLAELGYELPPAPGPMANYVSAQRCGDVMYLSGSGPIIGSKFIMQGLVGREISLEQGYEAAKLGALNLISVLKRELGDLDRVEQIVKLLGFVASAPDFYQQPAVINGASDVFVEVFGEKGKHARSAVAAPVLPFNLPVEVEIVVKIRD
ncbi:MAG: RidA family protein [Clostridia bacterium]|nr:RidA family protein [Clostridia bacterium]